MSDHAKKPEPVDVVIVGTGGGGGTAAKVLSEAGLKVVGLDRGPWIKPEQYSGDEVKYINRNYVWPDNILESRSFRPDADSDALEMPFSPLPFCVGGGTTHYAGWLPRPMPSDFRMRSLHGDIDGACLADWPISYDDLEPYLTKVEWAFGVNGLAEANRNEPPRSKPYPCPPPPPTQFAVQFYEACAKLGINAFPVASANVTTPHNGRELTNYTGYWNQFGDPSNSRCTTLTTFIPEALATGNYELRPDCYVQEVTVGPDGLAKGVVYEDLDGNHIEQEAKVVILAAGAIESARLMLLSKSNMFPEGIANSSGLVGKFATFHEYLFAIGLFDREVHDPAHGYTGYYISGGTMDFYETDEDRGHIAGCLITASMTGPPVNWVFPGRPLWGQAAKDADRDFFDYSWKIGIILHDMPQETNTVDLDPDIVDGWGLPVARITHTPHQNDVDMADWQIEKNIEILEAAGAATTVGTQLTRSTGNTCHQHGVARMGDDRSRSVLDKWCRAHDVPNLYVLDGSSFPTAMGVNPTLTIMANSWRCCDFIASEHAKGV